LWKGVGCREVMGFMVVLLPLLLLCGG